MIQWVTFEQDSKQVNGKSAWLQSTRIACKNNSGSEGCKGGLWGEITLVSRVMYAWRTTLHLAWPTLLYLKAHQHTITN